MIGLGLAVGLALLFAKPRAMWTRILSTQRIRKDASGDGRFGARRSTHTHQGVDLLVTPGETVRSPIAGRFVREGYPYRNDPRYRMIVVNGEGIEVRIMYAEPLPSLRPGDAIMRGQPIGVAQAVADKYGPPMLNHLHIEARRIVGAQLLDPTPFLGLA